MAQHLEETPITLRRIRRKADLAAITEIERACFPEDAFEKELLEKWLGQTNCRGHVAWQNGQIIGFLLYEVERKRLYIGDVAVVPQGRNKGLGRRLVQCVLRAAQSLDKSSVQLHVRVANAGAIKCYESVGFRISRTVPNYFGDMDAYLMICHRSRLSKAA